MLAIQNKLYISEELVKRSNINQLVKEKKNHDHYLKSALYFALENDIPLA